MVSSSDMYWSFRSLIKNLRKGKFKSILRVLWDPEYAQQIIHVKNVIARMERVLAHGQIRLHDIDPGHSINYPEWVDKLTDQILTRGWKRLEPIKVVYDSGRRRWLVVDGNHRFEALKRNLPGYVKIPVLILRAKDCPIDVKLKYKMRDQ